MFVHLRLHSEFSITNGIVRINDAVQAAAQAQQPALALTDLNNAFGAVKFYTAALKAGVQPILGADVRVQGMMPEKPNQPLPRLLLLAQNQVGYHNLCCVLSHVWHDVADEPHAAISWNVLQQYNDGIIALSGAQAGAIGCALLENNNTLADTIAQQCAATFNGRFYIELQRAGRNSDEPYIAAAVQLAHRLKLPVVATHPIQFLTAESYEAHEARVCIADGDRLSNPNRKSRFTPQQYFCDTQHMQTLFADIPSALSNTLEIAKRCHLTLTLGGVELPDYPTPDNLSTEAYFKQSAFEGLEERLQQRFPNEAERNQQRPQYEERLEFEINTILHMGFPGYFLIVADFINWAKNNDCPVGPGRGSGAGSLVAYALKITDLDPLAYGLLFERFLNPERISMPDFDIDFCQTNRDRVIDYVKGKYGADAVSQIATFGTMAARAAIRDVGRVLDAGYGFCDELSKLVPNKPGQYVTLQYPPADIAELEEKDAAKYALYVEPKLQERINHEEEVKNLIELAQQLEGTARNVGMHAGGVLIAPKKLTEFCPLYQQPGSQAVVSQFDKDDVESVGLIKFDFLGLATLTIMNLARNMIRTRHKGKENFVFEDVPLTDAATFNLFQKGQTESVFQFESTGMQRMLRESLPNRFEDLIALNAMYRPGPMDNIPSFNARKNGLESVDYPHPLLQEVLEETYGVMVYQEQVMLAAQIIGGYTLGGADILRRAMGKKKPEEMAQQREIFCAGAAKHDISEHQANEIFTTIEKFSGYGFNKSHAAAYALLAYQTAWLKTHYTAEFFCANMTVELDDTEKINALYEDAQNMGIRFEPPDINHSHYHFEPISDTAIRYGLGAIKGTGESAIAAIVEARKQGGHFTNIFDFCARVERQSLNKRTVEALIKAGAFDSLERNRAALFANVELAFEFGTAMQTNTEQIGLFDQAPDGHGSSSQEPELVPTTPWSIHERLMQEKTALGFIISGHLFEAWQAEMRQLVPQPLSQLGPQKEEQLLIGIVSGLRFAQTTRGKIAIFMLSDGTAKWEASANEAIYTHNEALKEDALIIALCTVKTDRFGSGLRIQTKAILDIAQARCRYGKHLRIDITPSQAKAASKDIAHIFSTHPSKHEPLEDEHTIERGLRVCVHMRMQDNAGKNIQGDIQLNGKHRFYPSDTALNHWQALFPQSNMQVVYARGDTATF